MKNSYLDSLRDKYHSPHQAWLAYTLQKNIWKLGVCHDNASLEIKRSIALQNNINKYCEEIVQNKNRSIECTVLEGNPVKLSILEMHEYFKFLGFDNSLTTSFLMGDFEMKLRIEAIKVVSWNQLNELMKEEGNINVPDIEESDMLEVCHSNGLNSILFSRSSAHQINLQKIDITLTQLSQIIGCHKKQVGLGKYNIAIQPTRNYAGESSQHFYSNEQKIFINHEKIDVLVHEWIHSIDNLWARDLNTIESHMSYCQTGVVSQLIHASTLYQSHYIEEIKKDLVNKSFIRLQKMAENYQFYFKREFKEFIYQNFSSFFCQNFDKDSFIKRLETYKKSSGYSYISAYFVTEIEMTNHMTYGSLNNSVFFEYAKKMDENLLRYGIKENYATNKVEMFARIFEAYCHEKLKSLGNESIISSNLKEGYIPPANELRMYWDKCENVVHAIKELIDKIYPMEKLSFEQSSAYNVHKMK